MSGSEEKRDINHVSPEMNRSGRNQRFVFAGNYFPGRFEEAADEEEEEIELSLGLSLNGRFGVDPKRAKKLTRSSSISDFMLTNDDGDNSAARAAPTVAYAPLIRTCSLPTETEEEWRKRKELQSLRRLEAKRKRLEKLKNVRTVTRDQVGVEEANSEGNVQAQSQGSVFINGSVGSRGSGSSWISESENQPTQGIKRCSTEARSPVSHQLPPKQNEQKLTPGTATQTSVKFAGGAVMGNPWAKVTDNNKEGKENMWNMMVEMPCVSTRGVGSDGKRIEGFLYRYRKGEEVRIVCVCHGSFLSPAEFVKHAGGGDVSHPLKHIVVTPSFFPL